jgi:hypothetical protein
MLPSILAPFSALAQVSVAVVAVMILALEEVQQEQFGLG